jgi:hypothetical protein
LWGIYLPVDVGYCVLFCEAFGMAWANASEIVNEWTGGDKG